VTAQKGKGDLLLLGEGLLELQLELVELLLVLPLLLQPGEVFRGAAEELELVPEGRRPFAAKHLEAHSAALRAGNEVFEERRRLTLPPYVDAVDRNQGVSDLNAAVALGRAAGNNCLDLIQFN
jgi:hypothetical protein